MKEIVLQGSQIQSQIYIEENLIAQAGEIRLGNFFLDCICVITDTNVAPLYLHQIKDCFRKNCRRMIFYVVEAGEAYKNVKTVEKLYAFLAENQFGRKDGILALGGGVIGDISGFVAATYLRGIDHLIQIPTTLLAQVDSSVGGKCGVDLPQGKNLVGAFRQPNKVFIDPMLVKSLKKEIFVAGLAEVIKYGCIFDETILEVAETFDLLKEGTKIEEKIEELVCKCVEIKTDVVERDEFERGDRKLLNFGHTVGHAVEKLGQYQVFSHGEAVSIGMVAALKMGENAGITEVGNHRRIERLLRRYQLPVKGDYAPKEVFQAMMSDKKRQGDTMNFVYAEKAGKGKIVEVKIKELEMQMEGLGEE
ncbi:MAG: 3-dehydroquinate synthase [Anaerovorax sp.]